MRTYQLIAIILIVLVFLTIAGYATWNGPKKDHLPLYEEIYEIKSRLLINITDPTFPSTGTRECIWFELREEDSGDYFQTTVNFWVFQAGQGVHGDIEAFVEIYNVPDRTDRFVIEVTRNSWFELTVSYNGVPFVVFPTVTENAMSYGYMTYEVAYNGHDS